MSKKGYVDYVLTEDSDIFAYDAAINDVGINDVGINDAERSCGVAKPRESSSVMIKYDFVKNSCCLVKKKDILSSLKLTQCQFLDMCILLSCDYNTRIRNYGPATVFMLITKYKSVDEIRKKKNMSIQDFEKIKYDVCQKIFTFEDVKTKLADEKSFFTKNTNDDVLFEKVKEKYGIY